MSKYPVSLATVKQGTLLLRPPRSNNPDQQSRNTILNTLYLGTLPLILAALLVVCINFFTLNMHYLLPRIVAIALIAGLMISFYALRAIHYRLATYGLISFYFITASASIALWGGQTPIGTLLFAMVIIIAGVLLGARYALYVLGGSITVLAVFTYLITTGTIHPDITWAQTPAGWYDIAVFAVILANLALVSWLFNSSMERSLKRARRSEKALRRQKQFLAHKVEQRTREAQAAHFDRIQEMYRFAELGHMSVGLLHDVANHLSVLSLDIEDLKEAQENRTAVATRVQESIHHLNSLTRQVRTQIKDESSPTTFNVAEELRHVAKLLEYKADVEHVTLVVKIDSPIEHFTTKGSLNQFWQIMTNLISNAIDAYNDFNVSERLVLIQARRSGKNIVVKVVDRGKGIPEDILPHIFTPFYSSKKHGTGVGLAISKRMVQKSFHGRLTATSSKRNGTVLTMTFANE